MPEFHEGPQLDGRGLRMAVVVARFNHRFTERLLEGALECLREHGVADDDVQVAHVPGAFEIPLCARVLARSGRFDAVVCLGAVIRGETAHFEYVSASVASGISQVALETDLPVIFGVLTTETEEQTLARAGKRTANKGWESAAAAIEMVHVLRGLRHGEA